MFGRTRELQAEIQRLRRLIHDERNEAFLQYAAYETEIRKLKRELRAAQ